MIHIIDEEGEACCNNKKPERRDVSGRLQKTIGQEWAAPLGKGGLGIRISFRRV